MDENGIEQDSVLTVVEVTLDRHRDTVVEAILTKPGKHPKIRRFKFVLSGVQKVKFGWLIGLVDQGHAALFYHHNEPGYCVPLRQRVAELQPLT